jgi:hypothetical protein
MKTVWCDLCGQQLTEVEGSVRLPSDRGTVTFSLLPYLEHRERLDVCWRCITERLLAVAPPRTAEGGPMSRSR